MNTIQIHSLFLIYFPQIISAYNLLGIIPISPRITNSKYNPHCLMNECCNSDYVKFDRLSLMKNLTGNVYGQPFVETVLEALTAHYSDYQARKPLTLSFHGMTGTGKNYASSFIADSLFRKGSKSQFVHHFIGRMHFSEKKEVSNNIQNLYHWLRGNITQCPTQLFIFDEVDKMIPEILDAIKPLMDYNQQGADFSQSVFIFLSNTAADIINEHYHDLYVTEGKERDELKLSDFENLIMEGAFNEEGGFFHCDTIANNLIDHYIPFLPLKQKHIVQCIEKEFRLRGVNAPQKNHIDEVMQFVEWGPDHSKLFSKTGCKRLGPKVAAIVSKWYRHAGHSKEEL